MKILNEKENASAKKLREWFVDGVAYADEWIDADYDGASDAARGPVTKEEFLDCMAEHVGGHACEDDDKSYWTDEFCPICALEECYD